ncbi:class I SAM-dependent methyltransferase [Patescibacteria group bacterium]|nr:class I SAM-dependent methyltransferase [Patescibacteria group bacterium]
MKCRFCSSELKHEFIDLGMSPPSNSYLSKEDLNKEEVYFPLKLWLCENCFLVQIDEYKSAREIFNNDYAYFSSYSTTWLNHAKNYVDMITDRLSLNERSNVIEIASNDGYLLQYFKKKNIPCLGIEPTANTAHVAINKGIETIIDYFTFEMSNKIIEERRKFDLILGNNVFAHVPNINDFVSGLKVLLNDGGTITLEFPHLLQLIENNQFDTIYHEHFWYFSLFALQNVFEKHRLKIYDVEELETHGGSLRLFVSHEADDSKSIAKNVKKLLNKEISKGINQFNYYKKFAKRIKKIKIDFLDFVIEVKRAGKSIAAYGAAAKGNTFLNYCGIKNDLIEFVVDASPHKQGNFLPGSHIPIVNEEYIKLNKPDYILILPWNIKDEITRQLKYVNDWRGQFVISIPSLEVIK